MPAALAVNWPEIQRALEMGAAIDVVASKYGVAVGTIAKRASRYDWFMPSKVAKAAMQQQRVGRLVRAQGMGALEGLGVTSGGSDQPPTQDTVPPASKIYAGGKVSRTVFSPLLMDSEALEKSLSALDTSHLVREAVAETWQTRGELVREKVFATSLRAMDEASTRGIMVTDAKDYKIMVGLAREATGQFKDSPAISLSIFQNEGEEGFSADAPTYEANSTVIPASSDDWL